MLQSMGSQRVGHDRATELKWELLWNALHGLLSAQKKLHYPESATLRDCRRRWANDGPGRWQQVCRAAKLTGTSFYNIQAGAEVFGGQLSILTTVLYIARNSTECKHLSLKLESYKFRICFRVPLSLVYG